MKKYRAEILTACAWLAGWALCTAALEYRSLWLGSLGLLAISLGGWRPLYQWITHGVYSLTRDSE